MGRTMPTECHHGNVIDWGDFGRENAPLPRCDECDSDLMHRRQDIAWLREHAVGALEAQWFYYEQGPGGLVIDEVFWWRLIDFLGAHPLFDGDAK